MKVVRLTSTKGKDYEFKGELLADASTLRPQTGQERWTELKVFVTEGGKYVCQKIGRTTIPGEINFSSIYHTENIEDIFKFFGASLVCRKIYEQLDEPYPAIQLE